MLMSDENQIDFEAHMKRLDWVVRLGVALIAFGFAIGGWVMRLEIQQGSLANESKQHATELTALNLWQAKTDGNRFTLQDFSKSSQIILESINGNDKRITRLEDSLARVEKLMERIELKLEK